MSSSEEDYKSSSSNEDTTSSKPAAKSRGRGAVPRALSNRRLSTIQQDNDSDNSDSTDIKEQPSRSNPKRYTTEDIDREIAMYKEQSSDSSSSDDSEDDLVAAKSKKKSKPKKKKKKPIRKKLGYKTQQATTTTKKKKQPAKNNKKKAAISKNKKAYGMKDDFVVNSDDSEEEEEEMLSSSSDASSKEESGEEWDANDSDARASSDSGGDDDSDSDSDFGAPKRKKAGKKKKANRGKAKKKKSTPAKSTRRTTRKTYQEQSSSSEEEEEIQYDTTPSGKRRPRRQCKTQTEEKMNKYVKSDMQSEREALGNMLEDDDKELLDKSDASDSDAGSSDDEGVVQTKKKSTKKKAAASPKMKNKYDEDEDYNEDGPSDTNNSSNSDEDMSDFEEESDEEDVPPKRRKSSRTTTKQRSSTRSKKQTKTTSYKDIDESDIGTADEDSNDEETGPSMLMSPARNNKTAYGSASSSPRARARMGRSPLDLQDDDEDSDSIGGKKSKKTKPKKKRRKVGSDESESSDKSSDDDGMDKKKKHTKLKTTHINCPSTIDDITMAKLPKGKPHVCYIAPDGKTRHCFALDTLYRIAISSKSNDNEPNIISILDSGSKPKLQFLQPPHFRSPMEDDLLDQIASRFGRGALVIEQSNVYKRMKGISLNTDDWEEFDSDGGLGEGTNFQARFERYIQNQMGSQDIYCCPLCFNEADRRMGNEDEEFREDDLSDDGKGGDEQKDRFRYTDDPLTILGRLDDEQFQIASTFCFRRLADVKTHLKVVHGCDTKEIAGNDLYKRFQIRTGDGLLQSWLKATLSRQTVQGDMMRYWNEGQNQSFVLLLSQIDKGRAIGEHSGEYGSDFSFSFPNRAKKIWRDVSAPFLKLSGEDMNDFIAGDDESEEEEGDALPINPNFTPPDIKEKFLSPEEQMIYTLKMKNRRRRSYLGSDASSKDSDSDSSSELEVLPKQPEYEEEYEEEEDMWEKGKSIETAKKRKARKRKSLKSTGDSDESSEDEDVFDSDADKKPAAKNGSARKVILDDEDESSDSDSDGDSTLPSFRKKKKSAHTLNFSDDDVIPIPKKTKPTQSGSAKKRIKEDDSSDEESL